ncbi:hypothetical protein [Bacillus altitudinis]|uniref:hypothetical protein n=1 Tax=Bacillus altitudinis TaxID=293387 RepID=UPI001C92BA3A|nr:hypothetical protein [Bacillus altitudinis]
MKVGIRPPNEPAKKMAKPTNIRIEGMMVLVVILMLMGGLLVVAFSIVKKGRWEKVW